MTTSQLQVNYNKITTLFFSINPRERGQDCNFNDETLKKVYTCLQMLITLLCLFNTGILLDI